MPIKNYASRMPAAQSVAKIQDMLVSHGATGIMFDYEPGTGRIQSLKFAIAYIDDRGLRFTNWRDMLNYF
jgi:hypothetical protein